MITLAELSALGRELLHADMEAEAAALALKEKVEVARRLREESIPMAMLELGLTKFVMDTGESIDIKQDVYVSVPAANKESAYDWLEQHGFGGMIKTVVAVRLGKGEIDKATDVAGKLAEMGFEPELTRDVHSQTLKAWLREQLAAAAELDLELFGARPVWTSKITAKKG